MRFIPKNGRLLVQPNPTTNNIGGILLPDSAIEKAHGGQVLEVCDTLKNEYKVGDVILYARGAGYQMQLNGKNLLVIKEQDVIGIEE
jgi:chaperonin GroES